MNLPIFVVNLASSSERLAGIAARLTSEGMDYLRIDAIDGRLTPPSSHPDYNWKRMRATMGRALMGGELGCILSHRRALAAFVHSGAPQAVVLEDDATLLPGFAHRVFEIADWLNTNRPDWRVVNLGHPNVKMFSRLREFSGHHLVAAHYYPMGAFALLWSRKGAVELLARGPKIEMPFDNDLQSWLCRVGAGYAVMPPLAGIVDLASEIDGAHAYQKPSRGGHKRVVTYGLKKQRRLWTNRLHAFRQRARFCL